MHDEDSFQFQCFTKTRSSRLLDCTELRRDKTTKISRPQIEKSKKFISHWMFKKSTWICVGQFAKFNLDSHWTRPVRKIYTPDHVARSSVSCVALGRSFGVTPRLVAPTRAQLPASHLQGVGRGWARAGASDSEGYTEIPT